MKLEKQFRIRASQCGLLMTSDRSGKGMGKTAQSYIEEWVKEQLYARKKEIRSKYIEKGIERENDAINAAAKYYGWGFVLKNEESRVNDFCTGTPDLILPEYGIDIKNSWDCFTFPLFDTELPDKNYYWQGQIYCELFDREEWRFVYCLMDAPEHEIDRRVMFEYDKNPDLDVELFEQQFRYGNVPDSLRFKSFTVKRDRDAYEAVKVRVLQARDYINQLIH